MPEVPTENDGIIAQPDRIFCQEHWEEIVGSNPGPEAGANGIEATLLITQHALANEEFYEIAYRIKNGYAPPDGDIGENERPDNVHINKALIKCSPLCCYLDDEVFEKVKKLEPPEELEEN